MHACERCGYATKRKTDLRKHLQRKRECRPILKDVPCSAQLRAMETLQKVRAHPMKFRKEEGKLSLAKSLAETLAETLAESSGVQKTQIQPENGELVAFLKSISERMTNIERAVSTATTGKAEKSQLKKSQVGSLYVIQEREFLNSNEPVFKIGRTFGPPQVRLSSYPKGSSVIWTCKVPDCCSAERKLMSSLASSGNFKHRGDIGAEYYEVISPQEGQFTANAEMVILDHVSSLRLWST